MKMKQIGLRGSTRDALDRRKLQKETEINKAHGSQNNSGFKGAPGTLAPIPLGPNSFIFVRFATTILQIINWCTPLPELEPPLGNPGSATVAAANTQTRPSEVYLWMSWGGFPEGETSRTQMAANVVAK